MQHIQLSKSDTELFKTMAMVIRKDASGDVYYHLPQYFKESDNDIYEVLTLSELPSDVKGVTSEFQRYEAAESFLNQCDTIVAGEMYTEIGYNTSTVDKAIKIACGLDY